MAENSDGDAQWGSLVKPLLSAAYGNFCKPDFMELTKAIIQSRVELMNHREEYAPFYASLMTLATDYYTTYCSSELCCLSKTDVELAGKACLVLIKYMLRRLSPATEEVASPAHIKQFIQALNAFCLGQSLLSKTDQGSVINSLKNSKLPPNIKTSRPGAREASTQSKESPAVPQIPIDLLLSTPLTDSVFRRSTLSIPMDDNTYINLGLDSVTAAPVTTDQPKVGLQKINLSHILSLRGGMIVLEMCTKLPFVSRYIRTMEENVGLKNAPSCILTYHEATSLRAILQSLVQELSTCIQILSLPIMDPVDLGMMDKLSSLGITVLYISVLTVMAKGIVAVTVNTSPKYASGNTGTGVSATTKVSSDDDVECYSEHLLANALEIFKSIGHILKMSRRTDGNSYLNYLLQGGYVIFMGLNSLMNFLSQRKEDRDLWGRDTFSRVSMSKAMIAFNTQMYTLVSHALQMLAPVFEEAQSERYDASEFLEQIDVGPLNVWSPHNGALRIVRLIHGVCIQQILFIVVTICFRKAYLPKGLQKQPLEGDTLSSSDSTTYYEDDYSCSDGSSADDEDDSEPILGVWFEETATPEAPSGTPATIPATDTESFEKTIDVNNLIVPVKGDPHCFIYLAAEIFHFMSKCFLNNRNHGIRRILNYELSEQMMHYLATLVKEVDREMARSRHETLSSQFGVTLSQLFSNFSQSLTYYCHNLVINEMLGDKHLDALLNHLGVPAGNSSVRFNWNLEVYPISLSILAQAVIVKQSEDNQRACFQAWNRFLRTLSASVKDLSGQSIPSDDLCVEHAQLMLFLFYHMRPSEKRQILIRFVQIVDMAAQNMHHQLIQTNQILHMSRILQLFEFVIRYYSNPPVFLIEQVKWNLFVTTSLGSEAASENVIPTVFYLCSEIEDAYEEFRCRDEHSIKPCFYDLFVPDPNYFGIPKLDEEALYIVVSYQDETTYQKMMLSVFQSLQMVTQVCEEMPHRDKLSITGLCAVRYYFTICWRLCLTLPPARQSLTWVPELTSWQTIYNLVWSRRPGVHCFAEWIATYLEVQQLHSERASELVKTYRMHPKPLHERVHFTQELIRKFLENRTMPEMLDVGKFEMPDLPTLMCLGAAIGSVHMEVEKISMPCRVPPGSSNPCAEPVQNLLPDILDLAEYVIGSIRQYLMNQIYASIDPDREYSIFECLAFSTVLSVMSTRCSKITSLAGALFFMTPAPICSLLEKWTEGSTTEYQYHEYMKLHNPSEKCVLDIVSAHISSIGHLGTYNINPALRNMLHVLVSLIGDSVTLCEENSELRDRAVNMMLPMTLDACMEPFHARLLQTLEGAIGSIDSEEHEKRLYCIVIERTLSVAFSLFYDNCPREFVLHPEKFLVECFAFLEKLLCFRAGRLALSEILVGSGKRLSKIFELAVKMESVPFATVVISFCNELIRKSGVHCGVSLENVISWKNMFLKVKPEVVSNWLDFGVIDQLRYAVNHERDAMPDSTIVPVSSGPTSTTVVPVTVSSTPTPTATPTPTLTPTSTPTPMTTGESAVTVVTSTTTTVATTSSTSTTGIVASPPLTQAAKSSVEAIIRVTDVPTDPSERSCDTSKALLDLTHSFIQAIAAYSSKENSIMCTSAASSLSSHLYYVGKKILTTDIEGLGFSDVMTDLVALADTFGADGYMLLCQTAACWLQHCKEYLVKQSVVLNLIASQPTRKDQQMIDATCDVMNVMSDILAALCPIVPRRPTSPLWEGETPYDPDTDWTEELGHEDDESGGEDSDEDSLCNKLCTFTITQREFINQHWYHCHTCKMVDGVGVCTVCARVCHRGHDITYSKYGNFFCDCGAKDDSSCEALVKRSPQGTGEPNPWPIVSTSPFAKEQVLPSSLRQHSSSPVNTEFGGDRGTRDPQRIAAIAKHMDKNKHEAMNWFVNGSNVKESLLAIMNRVMPAVEALSIIQSPLGCSHQCQRALWQLHTLAKKFESTDRLMVPTLGSQEGAFENVRMNYSGDQGQAIRQLLSAHMIRRVAMCCLSSPYGKRQHLAVSSEKGKITVLQLSALLKQADSSKRKLTLTRLASAPIPFTVLSITANQCNEDFLAVCGLKDCHVLTFSNSGSVADHLVLHPELESGNFIIRAIWLPGSQTQLALVTADFVKIYDLSKDALSPQYFFLVPSGKIRDCTFMYTECNSGYLLLMSSAGYIYSQLMDDESSAKNGPFYVTTTLEALHQDIKDVNGQVAGGGVSIYYSHTMQLLFFSYGQGRSFVGALTNMDSGLSTVFPINVKATSGNGNKPNNAQSQPLCQWTEVPNHPGLVCSVMQSSNNPVILMLKPDVILVQEIKVVPAKAKIMDMVAIRHPSPNADHRTTLILLCEDGSLRIYMASMDQTGFWLSPNMQPANSTNSMKNPKKKKVTKIGKPSESVTFPVDFFEHSQIMNDVEFGGNDMLQIYNTQQIKHRLNTTGMYLVSTKPAGFILEILNHDNSMVMTGVRVLLGTQDPQRAPSYIEVSGRSIPTNVTRNRWFDLPLTREESLQTDKKFSVTFGPSQDPEGVVMIDSIKVYGKSKNAFGWPEEVEDLASGATVPSQTIGGTNTDVDSVAVTPVQLTYLDKLVTGILECLEGVFLLYLDVPHYDQQTAEKSSALTMVTGLLTLPTPVSLRLQVNNLLAALLPSRIAYEDYKDQALLKDVLQELFVFRNIKKPRELEAEAFYRVVLIVRSIALSRPCNLLKFPELDKGSTCDGESKMPEPKHLMIQLKQEMWRLLRAQYANPALAPVCVPGLTHVETVVHAIVDIVHAFILAEKLDESTVQSAAMVYLQLLLCDEMMVSFGVKQAITRVLRPRIIRRRGLGPTSDCSTPRYALGELESVTLPSLDSTLPSMDSTLPSGDSTLPSGDSTLPSVDSTLPSTDSVDMDVDAVEPMQLIGESGSENSGSGSGSGSMLINVNPMDTFLNVAGNFPQLMDIPPDADDETMVELAIALSLQDHEGGPELQVLHQGLQGLASLQGLQNLGGQSLQSLQVLASQGLAQVQTLYEAGHFSDTTASAGGSDDEGSTAATDGSTLRTSPAEHGGSGCSGSGGDSIIGDHNVSAHSSAYGDTLPDPLAGGRGDARSLGAPADFLVRHTNGLRMEDQDHELDDESNGSLHAIRMLLLDEFVEYVKDLKHIGGVRSIPFLQVMLMLISDMDCETDSDNQCLMPVLFALCKELRMKEEEFEKVCERTRQREVQLLLLRMFSVMMSRYKANAKASVNNWSFVSHLLIPMLVKNDLYTTCFQFLKNLLPYWKKYSATDEAGGTIGGSLLKPHPTSPAPDMSPFLLRQYVKGHATDVFEAYPQLLTEMCLRLPYQMLKLTNGVCDASEKFIASWNWICCEYLLTHLTPFVRRQVRKLLLHVCGSKEKYRQLRDIHSLDLHMSGVFELCEAFGYSLQNPYPSVFSLPYDSLVELIEHLKGCVEIATNRTLNWQYFCTKYSRTGYNFRRTLCNLLQIACLLDEEGVSPTILQLLQCGVCPSTSSSSGATSSGAQDHPGTQSIGTQASRERERSDEPFLDARILESQSAILVTQLNAQVSHDMFMHFIRTFLLEANSTTVRWQAHALVIAMYRHSPEWDQELTLDALWKLWPLVPAYGRKASQFVDLLGFFTIKSSLAPQKMSEYLEQAVNVLHAQNQLLAHHPNASLYMHLTQYVELEGYYLESEPCLVCNNPEVPMSSMKLSSIKIDSKFTTTTQIVKLVGSHTISKITLRIGDLKRTKMVRTINVYYNNRCAQAVVELKNKPAMWHKAKKVSLAAGQTEVKIEFSLPIVACNLMIEYAEFYENIQASSETLQCPRCSASVPANPGVCANCGENVFQCHKCRAINYDEKDPFLCHACGFCKYAKFDYTLTARPCCAVDPIENDEDRKKTVTTINNLLEKADRVYKQLIGNKPALELALLKISEQRGDRTQDDSGSSPGSSLVNKNIQQLAQRYGGECKNSYEELSKISQRVVACRRELVAYDRSQRIQSCSASYRDHQIFPIVLSTVPVHGRCYGCASAATDHCLTLLKALASNNSSRQILCSKGLVAELLEYNLRQGSVKVQDEVRQLLCELTSDDEQAIEDIRALLLDRISLTLRGHVANYDLAYAVRHEMALLAALVQKDDSCWEQKLRCVMQLFLMACNDAKSPVVIQSILLPCLKILESLINPEQPMSRRNKDKTISALATIRATGHIGIDLMNWLHRHPCFSFHTWYLYMPSRLPEAEATPPLSEEELRLIYLMEKYANRWREKIRYIVPLWLMNSTWLKVILFNPSSRLTRQVVCNILECLCHVPERKREVLDLLTSFLCELSTAGENAAEFLCLYRNLIEPTPWKEYLALRGVLFKLASLITQEIEELHKLEDNTLTSDLAQGYAPRMLTELLASFLEQDNIKRLYKGRLVSAVLNGYLSLRRLVVQRTRLIDETQEKLLELLEEMTTGTEEETKAFMVICIQTVQKCSLHDIRTPVFIFERLCSIIYPEENDCGEFYLTLEKDPQQEDFLQGRMLGNPYSSLEAGLGPLMRDVKNKICLDCELVALLEDDNGMELLVNNKIISLNLPVRDVYKKVWLAEGGDGDTMRVIYRMRGLLGDATEEFVETLDAKSELEVNNEEVYKMASVMADCGGLHVVLDRLASIKEPLRTRPLLQVSLKLFLLCMKVQCNLEVLMQPELRAINVFLGVLQMCLNGEGDSAQGVIIEQLLDIMETILSNAASQSREDFLCFSHTFGGTEPIKALLFCTKTPGVQNNPAVLAHLMRVVAALTYGNKEKMAVLCMHFKCVTNFNKFDNQHTPGDERELELLCVLTEGIERNAIGNTLKDHIVSLGLLQKALDYIRIHAPSVSLTKLLKIDSDDWKNFITKPALKYVLRFLGGMATEHEPSQLHVASDFIPIIHRLEQVSSDEHVGSLAENLLEALRTHPHVANCIEEVREQTRAEKKRLAMALREKELGALNMRTNEKGQVTAQSTLLMEDLGEEPGLQCCICREGYKYHSTKVLGIYTFTKRCNVEEFEMKPRKTVGYSTVTHFNVVHVDCHMSAVRLARARDEWESAALQNANTRCNGLLPLWGPQVPESAFASCLARHNTYLQESTGHRDINYSSTVHDLKLLLLRFAQEKTFHEDTGGGGPQSNMHIIPYLIHMALYVINTTRSAQREDKNLITFVRNESLDRWLESSYEAEGPLYWCVFSILLHSPERWSYCRLPHLRRLLVMAQTRHVQPAGLASPPRLDDRNVKEFSVYKSYLILFGLVDGIYSLICEKVNVTSDDQWPTLLADYIRHNDEALLKASEQLLAKYRDELLPCTSFLEFCDITALYEIDNPYVFIAELLNGLE